MDPHFLTGKTLVCNLQYGPRTQLVGGMYEHTLGEKSTGSSPLQSNATIDLNLLLSSAFQIQFSEIFKH